MATHPPPSQEGGSSARRLYHPPEGLQCCRCEEMAVPRLRDVLDEQRQVLRLAIRGNVSPMDTGRRRAAAELAALLWVDAGRPRMPAAGPACSLAAVQ